MKASTKHWLPTFAMTAALVAAMMLSPEPASTQQRADASLVAAQVQGFYDQTTSIDARFHQTYYHRLYRRYQRSTGRLVFDKPGRMRFDYRGGKVVVSDGDDLTAYEPGDDGGAGQYMRTTVSQDSLAAGFGFLTGSARIGEDYRYQLLDSQAWGFSGHILELTPRRPDPRIRRVILYVDADPRRAGVIHRIRIDDHDGNRNKFDLRSMRFNRTVSDARFAFSPPRGARRMGAR